MFAKQGCDRKAYKKVKVLLTLHFWFFSRSDPDRCDKRYGYVIYIHICIIYTMYIFYYIYHMWMYIVFFCVNTSLIHDTWIICIPDFSKGEFIGSPSWKRRAISRGYHGDIMGIYQGDISWGYHGDISWGFTWRPHAQERVVQRASNQIHSDLLQPLRRGTGKAINGLLIKHAKRMTAGWSSKCTSIRVCAWDLNPHFPFRN